LERGSKLTRIGPSALSGCSVNFICLPASLEVIPGSAIPSTMISVRLEEGDRHFRVSDDFLFDIDGRRAIRYFGSASHLTLSRNLEILGRHCFYGNQSLCSLSFESGSRLREIELGAFSLCLSLQSICLPASLEVLHEFSFFGSRRLSSLTFESESRLREIHEQAPFGCLSPKSLVIPRSIQTPVRDWALRSSLEEVIFESALSLRTMIQAGRVDLSGDFKIKVIEADCELDLLKVGKSG
jgi:hypothetical protein